MPFTIGGDYMPPEKPSTPSFKSTKKPIRVRVEKRKQSFVTIIENLPFSEDELKTFLSTLKKKFSCGGTSKDGLITLQGNFEAEVKKLIDERKN